jgi:hypothetical protein
MRSLCVPLENFERDFRRIRRCHRLVTRSQEQSVSPGTASQVQSGPKRQQRQQFPNKTNRFRQRMLSGGTMLRVPVRCTVW